MIPPCGTPLSGWTLAHSDFEFLHDQRGNGRNLVALAYTWFEFLKDSPVDGLAAPLTAWFSTDFVADVDGLLTERRVTDEFRSKAISIVSQMQLSENMRTIKGDKPYRTASAFYKRLSYGLELPVMIKEFAVLGDLFITGLEIQHGKFSFSPLYRQFARTPIFREYVAWTRSFDPKLFLYILSFLWYGRKAVYYSDELDGAALSGWLDVEDELLHRVLPEHVTEDLRRLVLLSNLEMRPDEMWPKHGPGQNAELLDEKTVHNKNQFIKPNRSVVNVVAEILRSWMIHPDRDASWLIVPDVDVWYHYAEDPQFWAALLQFVPKDYKSVRSICMEPIVFMWAQQAVRHSLESGITRSKFGKVVDITNQGLNRDSAIYASLSGKHDTIDLSSASDRLGWDLVCAIFPEEMLYFFEHSRTTVVSISDPKRPKRPIHFRVRKFAPMGSALCFPVQSVVYACVVALAHIVVDKGLDPLDYLSEGMSVVTGFPEYDILERVYGDDLITLGKYTQCVITLLQSLGFKVNTRKSFTGSQALRESCGVYAVNGRDVTPLIFKVKGLETETYDSWLGCIEFANRAYDAGYSHLRNALLTFVPRDAFVEMEPESPYRHQAHVVKGTPTPPGSIWWNDDKCLNPEAPKHLQKWMRRIQTPVTDYTSYRAVESELEAVDRRNAIAVKASNRPPLTERDLEELPEFNTFQDLERYEYGWWLFKPSNTEGKDKPPRIGVKVPTEVKRRWTPLD